MCCGFSFKLNIACFYFRLLETDERALTKITNSNSIPEGTEQQRQDVDHKILEQQKSTGSDRKSIGSMPDNELLSDSPSLNRKATEEEMWYVTKCYFYGQLIMLLLF